MEKENQNNENIKKSIKIEGIYEFCRQLYKKIYTKEEFDLDIIFLIIEFIKLSNFQKKKIKLFFKYYLKFMKVYFLI